MCGWICKAGSRNLFGMATSSGFGGDRICPVRRHHGPKLSTKRLQASLPGIDFTLSFLTFSPPGFSIRTTDSSRLDGWAGVSCDSSRSEGDGFGEACQWISRQSASLCLLDKLISHHRRLDKRRWYLHPTRGYYYFVLTCYILLRTDARCHVGWASVALCRTVQIEKI